MKIFRTRYNRATDLFRQQEGGLSTQACAACGMTTYASDFFKFHPGYAPPILLGGESIDMETAPIKMPGDIEMAPTSKLVDGDAVAYARELLSEYDALKELYKRERRAHRSTREQLADARELLHQVNRELAEQGDCIHKLRRDFARRVVRKIDETVGDTGKNYEDNLK